MQLVLLFLMGGVAAPVAVWAGAAPSRGTDLGFGAGLAAPLDHGATLDPTLWLTANLRVPLGARLWLEPEIGYWQREADRDSGLTKVLNLGANLLLSSRGKTFRGWAGIGVGVHIEGGQELLTNYEGEIVVGEDTFTEPVPRIQLLAGVDCSVSPRTTLFVAGRLDTLFKAEDDDLARQWKLYFGMRWRLP